MNTFNGQINISRDLRQNKQTIFGKRDLTDIIFIVLGIGIAVLFAYLIGFYFKILDEFTATIISLIPMVLILAFGFRKKAGIRWIYYILFRFYEGKSRVRSNKELFNNVIEVGKKGTKKIKGSKIIISNDDKNSNKIKVNTNIVSNKSIFVFSCKEDIKTNVLKYIENPEVAKIQIRLKNGEKKILFLYNFSYKEFLKNYIKNEYKFIGNNDKLFTKLKKKFVYLLRKEKDYNSKFSMFINFEKYNKEYFDKKSIELLNSFNENRLSFIDINDDFIKKLDIQHKKVYMLHLYKSEIYEKLVNELINVAEVVINIIKHREKYYISTFIVFDGDDSEIIRIIDKFGAVINKLKYEQGMAKSQVVYTMQNPFNNYREYKING